MAKCRIGTAKFFTLLLLLYRTLAKAYEDLQRDGFIETTVGRGSFVSAQNKDFYQEEQQRQAEEHLQQAADIGRTSGIPVEKLVELLRLFYEDQEV